MNDFIRNVVWPAVAGNIAWSFLSLGVPGVANGEPWSWEMFWRLSELGLLAAYLCAVWILPEPDRGGDWSFEWYCAVELSLAASFAAFAVATQSAVSRWWLLDLTLAASFVILAVGHLARVWVGTDADPELGKKRQALGWANLGAAAVVVVSCQGFAGDATDAHAARATVMAAMVGVWLWLKFGGMGGGAAGGPVVVIPPAGSGGASAAAQSPDATTEAPSAVEHTQG